MTELSFHRECPLNLFSLSHASWCFQFDKKYHVTSFWFLGEKIFAYYLIKKYFVLFSNWIYDLDRKQIRKLSWNLQSAFRWLKSHERFWWCMCLEFVSMREFSDCLSMWHFNITFSTSHLVQTGLILKWWLEIAQQLWSVEAWW